MADCDAPGQSSVRTVVHHRCVPGQSLVRTWSIVGAYPGQSQVRTWLVAGTHLVGRWCAPGRSPVRTWSTSGTHLVNSGTHPAIPPPSSRAPFQKGSVARAAGELPSVDDHPPSRDDRVGRAGDLAS